MVAASFHSRLIQPYGRKTVDLTDQEVCTHFYFAVLEQSMFGVQSLTFFLAVRLKVDRAVGFELVQVVPPLSLERMKPSFVRLKQRSMNYHWYRL